MIENIGLADGLDLGYKRKKGVKDDFTYFDLSNWKALPFTEMEKEELQGFNRTPNLYVWVQVWSHSPKKEISSAYLFVASPGCPVPRILPGAEYVLNEFLLTEWMEPFNHWRGLQIFASVNLTF